MPRQQQGNWVMLNVLKVERETEKALQLLLEGGELLWFPKSHIKDPEFLEVGQEETEVEVSRWIATEKGLVDE